MTPRVTVLYEDAKAGKEYPLHALVLRMLEDDKNGATWKIRKAVFENPRNGVGNVLNDVRATQLHAGAGKLFVLIDRDAIIEHLNDRRAPGEAVVPPKASDADIEAAVKRTSDAPSQVAVFLLRPNIEGLLASIATCAPGQWTAEITAARHKQKLDGASPRTSRDFVFQQVSAAAMAEVRRCVRQKQPGLDALITALGAVLPPEALAA